MWNNLAGSLFAVLIGFAADLVFGDPATSLHPICLIGKLIAGLEYLLRKLFPKTQRGERCAGTVLALAVVTISFGVPVLLLAGAYRLGFWCGVAAESVMCWFIFAVKSLKDESMQVAKALENNGLEAGRRRVARIVGRDTQNLSETGVVKAAVETVAENFSDGVFAPMFYLMLGGGALGFAYKGINTMDSMLGYKNERYLYFGRFAARLDDAANYIPSRLAALALIVSAGICRMDWKAAFCIWKRDRRKHASPNSAQTEAAVAGALQIQLAGDAYYFGKLHQKPYIGDEVRPVETEDIARANRLMVCGSVVSLSVMAVLKLMILMIV